MSTQSGHEFLTHPTLPLVPPLENGDHLTRAEFERRWEAMPRLKTAELIEGVVHMAAAVRAEFHGVPHARMISWLGEYAASTPGSEAAACASVRLDSRNEPQPDVMLRVTQGGQSVIDGEGYLVGAPELAAEVAASSASYDLHEKLKVYERHGVREYLVWRVIEKQFDWFVLREGRYAKLAAEQDGILRSEFFPGLWLDAAALLRGDGLSVRRALDQGLATPQHAGFVAALEQRKQ
jgi:Uma2 family endonuclease